MTSRTIIKRSFKGETMLLLAALIWGSSFLFQKTGMDYVGPLTFGFFRFAIGALILLPFIYISDKSKGRKANDLPEGQNVGSGFAGSCEAAGDVKSTGSHQAGFCKAFLNKTLLTGGIIIGLANFLGATFQQVGLIYTTAGKAGFITSMDLVFVPIILMIFFKKSIGATTWISVLTACVGLYFLCMSDGFSLQLGDGLSMLGDGLVMLCALFYALQIIFIDYYVDSVDPIRLAFVEFAITALLSGILMFIFEDPALNDIIACAVPILYTGVLEVGCAFTLEILGQKYVAPSIAAVLMSFEAVFAVICGMIFLGELMCFRETIGCLIMFAAFIVSQLSTSER